MIYIWDYPVKIKISHHGENTSLQSKCFCSGTIFSLKSMPDLKSATKYAT